jgi:hypothetical protein
MQCSIRIQLRRRDVGDADRRCDVSVGYNFEFTPIYKGKWVDLQQNH